MAAKPRLTEEALTKLGPEKLAQLVCDEANRNASFRRRVSAAIAAGRGPEAVAAVADRRLAALERARGVIDWESTKSFAADLQATIAVIVKELGRLDPDTAIDRLIRFLATAEGVFERVDDSSGRIQGVYYDAADAVASLIPALGTKQKTRLPDRLHRLVVDGTPGFTARLFEQMLPLLPASAIDAWDLRLKEEASSHPPAKDEDGDWRRRSKLALVISLRQAIADVRSDCDAFIALELSRDRPQPDTLAIAERLLRAGRYAESLEWARKPGPPRVNFIARIDPSGQVLDDATETPDQVRLELRILEAMGDRVAAQALRWRTFLEVLDGAILREYVDRLGDFEEFEVLDRAFAHAATFKDKCRALTLFLAWPRLDLASHLVIDNEARWDGRDYGVLAPAAEALEQAHPIAATILYRSLLDSILDSGRSQAYGHAARYFEALAVLASRIASDDVIASHTAYTAELRKKHGRKSGFWFRLRDGV
jgi:Family of unknown function (DUF6880)